MQRWSAAERSGDLAWDALPVRAGASARRLPVMAIPTKSPAMRMAVMRVISSRSMAMPHWPWNMVTLPG